MKQRNTKKRLETPKVIELADGSKKLATTSDLVEAAKDPAAALADPVVTEENSGSFVPVNDRKVVEDADFEDIPPQSEAELAAAALVQSAQAAEQGLDANEDEAQPEKFEKLGEFLDNKDPPGIAISEFSLNWIKDLPLKLAAGADSLSKWTADVCRQTWLRSIALWNDTVDYAKKLGNQVWAWYDKQEKLKSFVAGIKRWRSEQRLNEPLLYGSFFSMMNAINDRIESGNKLREEEKASNNKRLKKLEGDMAKLLRAVNRTGPVSGNDLIEFGKAVSQGRKTGAINIFHKMTGASLADSKAAIDGMLPA